MFVSELLEVCQPHSRYEFYDNADPSFPLDPFESYYDRDAAIIEQGDKEVVSWNVEDNGEESMYDPGTDREWTGGPIGIWVEL